MRRRTGKLPEQGQSLEAAMAACTAAAAPVLDAIRREAQEAPAPLGRVLEYIADHLLDHGFNAAQAFRGAEVRDSHARLRFHNELGQPPAAYILDARMQVAAQMLVATQLSAARLSELVGYGKPESFARAFQRWSGARPNAFRQRWLEADGLGPSTQPFLSRSFRARAAAGQLDHPELITLLTNFRVLYPQSAKIPKVLEEVDQATATSSPPRPDPAESSITKSWQLPVLTQPFDLLAVEQPKAAEALRLLDQAGYHEALHRVRNWRFRSPALFEVLSQRSVAVGRRYRPAAVPWMRLALASIEGIDARTCTTRERGSLRARAFAWLATALRRTSDYKAAERMLGLAINELENSRPDEEVESEVKTLLAIQHLYQNRVPQALSEVERALQLHRYCSDPGGRVRALNLLGSVFIGLGQPERAVSTLREAQELAHATGDIYMNIVSGANISGALMYSGKFAKACALAAEVRQQAQARGALQLVPRIDMIAATARRQQGHLNRAAQLLQQARSSLEQMGQRDVVAILTGELALVRLQQDRRQEAERLAQTALHVMRKISFVSGIHEVAIMVRAVLNR